MRTSCWGGSGGAQSFEQAVGLGRRIDCCRKVGGPEGNPFSHLLAGARVPNAHVGEHGAAGVGLALLHLPRREQRLGGVLEHLRGKTKLRVRANFCYWLRPWGKRKFGHLPEAKAQQELGEGAQRRASRVGSSVTPASLGAAGPRILTGASITPMHTMSLRGWAGERYGGR